MAKVPKEVTIDQYELRSVFLSTQLVQRGYLKLFDQAIATIKATGGSLDWSDVVKYNVDPSSLGQEPVGRERLGEYFCHPALLIANPANLRYYRCIAAMSEKGLGTIADVHNVKKIEEGAPCNSDKALRLAQAMNRNLNRIYRAIGETEEQRRGLLLASAGTSLDGSWRNVIGTEGERVVKVLLLTHLFDRGELVTVIDKKGRVHEVAQINAMWLQQHTSELQSAMCGNGAQMTFGSEPDVTCYLPNGATAAGIEVKAGIDPAGAQERFGAMLKSFEKVLALEPNADTILVASCITDEVQRQLNGLRNKSLVFMMTDLINDPKGKGTAFCNDVRGCLGLVAKRL